MGIKIMQENCICCGACAVICPKKAISIEHGRINVDDSRCVSCGRCICKCYMRAIFAVPDGKSE